MTADKKKKNEVEKLLKILKVQFLRSDFAFNSLYCCWAACDASFFVVVVYKVKRVNEK